MLLQGRMTVLTGSIISVLMLVLGLAMTLGGVLLGTGITPEAYAQSLLAGDITGTVLDPSGSAVTGVTVTAKSKATETTASVKTDAQGAFRFALFRNGSWGHHRWVAS
jgi:hypothetical protein